MSNPITKTVQDLQQDIDLILKVYSDNALSPSETRELIGKKVAEPRSSEPGSLAVNWQSQWLNRYSADHFEKLSPEYQLKFVNALKTLRVNSGFIDDMPAFDRSFINLFQKVSEETFCFRSCESDWKKVDSQLFPGLIQLLVPVTKFGMAFENPLIISFLDYLRLQPQFASDPEFLKLDLLVSGKRNRSYVRQYLSGKPVTENLQNGLYRQGSNIIRYEIGISSQNDRMRSPDVPEWLNAITAVPMAIQAGIRIKDLFIVPSDEEVLQALFDRNKATPKPQVVWNNRSVFQAIHLRPTQRSKDPVKFLLYIREVGAKGGFRKFAASYDSPSGAVINPRHESINALFSNIQSGNYEAVLILGSKDFPDQLGKVADFEKANAKKGISGYQMELFNFTLE